MFSVIDRNMYFQKSVFKETTECNNIAWEIEPEICKR